MRLHRCINPQSFAVYYNAHDVDFSPKRAYDLGALENSMGIKSTFFFQVTNNLYNILSHVNLGYLTQLKKMGHHLGLHFHLNGMDDIDEIKRRIQYEVDLLSFFSNTIIDRFSFHRPSALVLKSQINLEGIINAYSKEFFTYVDTEDSLMDVNVKYIADSKNEWQYLTPYECPDKLFFEKFKKIQILCHPCFWTERGYSTLENLKTLIVENRTEFIHTLNSETKYVKEYISEL